MYDGTIRITGTVTDVGWSMVLEIAGQTETVEVWLKPDAFAVGLVTGTPVPCLVSITPNTTEEATP